MQGIRNDDDIVFLLVQLSIQNINKSQLFASQPCHLLILGKSIWIDSSDIIISHLLQRKRYFSTSACKIYNFIILTDKFVIGTQFLLHQSLDVVFVWIGVLLTAFFIEFFNSHLVVDSSEPSLHLQQLQQNSFNLFQKNIKILNSFLLFQGFSWVLFEFIIISISLITNQMSNPKGGMQFFKKFAEKGGMFSNMKIKGPKQTKNVAQTETNFNFSDKSSEQQKSSQSLSRDDLSIKQQIQEIQQPVASEIKTEDLSIKKTKSKPAETSLSAKKIETPEVEVKKVEQPPKETKEIKYQKKIEVSKPKPNTSQEKSEIVQQKKSEKSSPTSAISQKKKLEKATTKKAEDAVIRKPSMNIKQQKKKQDQKQKKSAKEQILDQINEYNIKLALVVINQKNNQTKICNIKEQINELRQKISKWSSQQSLCAEREQYDEAEGLQNRIQQALNKVDELTTDIGLAEDQLLKLEAQQINILKSQNENLNKIGRKLKLIEIQLQNDAAMIKREQVEKIETLKNKQQIEKKKIQRIEKDISYQSQQISQLQKIVKQEQQIKLNPLLRYKSEAQNEKVELQNEIKQLEKKLKQKKSQLSDTNKHLKSINDSITEVNESFKDENIKLQQRKNNLEIIENDHDNMIIEMTNLEQTIEEESKIMNTKIQKKLGQATEIASLAKNFQQKLTTFEDQLENRKVAFDNFTQNGKLLKQFQEKHRSEKDKIKQIQFKKGTISAEMSKHQQKRDAIRKKIPIIEAEQKKFADQKNFKAAGLKKSEIKQLNDQLTIVKEKIQAAIIQQHALGIEEQKLNNAQKQNIEQEQSLQRNLAISQYRYCTIKIEKINEYKEAISKNSAFNSKQKDKIIKQLNELLNRRAQQLKYLEESYLLTNQKHNCNEEQQEILEADQGNNQIDEQSVEHRHLTDNNNQQEVDNTNEQERIEEQAESGYIPLDIPEYKEEEIEQQDEK